MTLQKQSGYPTGTVSHGCLQHQVSLLSFLSGLGYRWAEDADYFGVPTVE